MKDCKQYKKNLVALVYGELRWEKKKHLESHLRSCPQCKSEVEQLKEVIKGADSLKADIKETMASIDWETLPSKISEAVFKKETSISRRSPLESFLKFLFQAKLRPVYAGVLAGILLGALVTFVIFRTPHLREARERKLFVSKNFLERMELEMARRETLDYLDKSQYLLLDFVQPPSERATEFWQIDFATQRAKDLLGKKKYIDQQLDKFQMAKAKVICDQIEFLFFELTQISGQLSVEDLRRIQNFIEEKQLLLKIKLLRKDLEESEV